MDITVINNEIKEYFEPLLQGELIDEGALAIGAIDDGTACGVLIGNQEGDVFRITYLYVSQKSRRLGAGTGMCQLLGEICIRCGINGICIEMSDKDDSKIKEFFKALDYSERDTGSPIYKFQLADVNATMLDRKITISDGDIVKLENALDREFNALRVERNDARELTVGDVIPNIEDKKYYNQQLSHIIIKDHVPTGCILISGDTGNYVIEYLYVSDQNYNPIDVMGLISEGFQAAINNTENEAVFYVNAANKSVEGIINKLTEGKMKKCGNSVMLFHYI